MKVRNVLLIVLMLALSGCFEDASRLQVGMTVPSLRTKTLQDVGGDLTKITSYRYPDERMYEFSLDQALASGKPVLLEFATPGHCTVCDTQLQMLKGLLEKYHGQVVFLHLDQYQNPQAFKAYTVIGDPWTFVIDGKQTVRYKQAGRMLYGELEAVIQGVLKSSQTNTASAS
jgi:thiol-disulfide isomerase/thioredoxin